jgi:hypothetical protein
LLIFLLGLPSLRCARSGRYVPGLAVRSAPPLLRCGRVCALTRAPLHIARPLACSSFVLFSCSSSSFSTAPTFHVSRYSTTRKFHL